MTEATIEDRIKRTISESLGILPDRVTPDAEFLTDLGADSLDVVSVVMDLEAEFKVEIPDEDLECIETVSDATAAIRRLVNPA